MDNLTKRCKNLLAGSYDCVDRVVLNAYFWIGHNPGGFRYRWRLLHGGSDEHLDNTHLMRMAGRFSRRVRGFARSRGIPVIDCGSEERKHEIAEEFLSKHEVGTGLFMVLVARAPAATWDVQRNKRGVICNLAKRRSYVNHYSFHIMDPTWGHVTIKMAGHPPFDAQVMLNGHEYVAAQAKKGGVGFSKEGNCFVAVPDPQALAEIADTLSRPEAIGLLSQAADRWIYSTCLGFALDAGQIEATRFTYSYSVYQVEYSRNLIFTDGSELDDLFGTMADRIRSRIDVPVLRTLFGLKKRPRRKSWGKVLKPREAVVIETPSWDLTIFKIHFGLLTLKGYTKGEHVARFEAITHNTRALGCGRTLERFPEIVAKLRSMTDRFTTMLDCVHVGFLPDGILDELHSPSTIGTTRVGGIDLNKPRVRNALAAALALAVCPGGFTVSEFGAKVQAMTGQSEHAYTIRQAAYDLRKLRGKHLVDKPGRSRRYGVPEHAARIIVGLSVLRDQVLIPILAGLRTGSHDDTTPTIQDPIDTHYETLRHDMRALIRDLGITTEGDMAA
jgi:hypothetical protein